MNLPDISQLQKHSKLLPWLIWGVAALFVLFQFMLQGSTSVMVPYLIHDFKINMVDIGILSASFIFTYIALQVPTGILIDRYGPRLLLSIAIVFTAVACFVFAKSHEYWLAVSSRLMMGFFTAPALVATLYLGSLWFPANRFALICGLTEAAGMLGGAIGAGFLPYGVKAFGWRFTMIICAVIALLIAILIRLFVREKVKHSAVVPGSGNTLNQLRYLIKIPQVWYNSIYAGLMFSLTAAFASLWCVPYLMHVYNVDLTKAGGACSMMFLGMVIGSPFWGWISDRMERRLPAMMFGTIASIFCLNWVIYYSHMPFWMMTTLLFTLGFVCSVYIIPYAIVREITPKRMHGTALGFINTLAVILGAPILQPFIGWLLQFNHRIIGNNIDHFFTAHDYKVALSPLIVCYLLAFGLLFFIKETYCKLVPETNEID